MKVVPLPEVEPGTVPRSVAIGTFDGVHLGHREVIRGSDTVLTFDPHPMSVIRPDELLRSHSEFETHVTPLVEVEGEAVSSTQIRGLVAAGEVKEASAFLGGPFLFEGQVAEGDRVSGGAVLVELEE